MQHERTHLDLFSGIGGFALACRIAAERTGVQIRTTGFCERDPYCQRVLAKHWPGVPCHADIRNYRPTERPWLLTGGFPCQPFSVAGKRGGAADDRFLWPEMLRVIVESRPAWVLGENVAGFVSMELDRCLFDLEAIGYTARPFVIPACAVDAPHRRDRVWIMANASERRFSGAGEWKIQQPRGAEAVGASENVAGLPVMAKSGRGGRRKGGAGIGQTEGACAETSGPSNHSENVADAGCSGLTSGGIRGGKTASGEIQHDGTSDGGQTRECRWPSEPNVGRVAHGVRKRVDRLKALGNSIVPQVAAEIIVAMILSET